MSRATNGEAVRSAAGLIDVVICGPTPPKSGVAITSCQSSSTWSTGSAGVCAFTDPTHAAQTTPSTVSPTASGRDMDLSSFLRAELLRQVDANDATLRPRGLRGADNDACVV